MPAEFRVRRTTAHSRGVELRQQRNPRSRNKNVIESPEPHRDDDVAEADSFGGGC